MYCYKNWLWGFHIWSVLTLGFEKEGEGTPSQGSWIEKKGTGMQYVFMTSICTLHCWVFHSWYITDQMLGPGAIMFFYFFSLFCSYPSFFCDIILIPLNQNYLSWKTSLDGGIYITYDWVTIYKWLENNISRLKTIN